MPGRLARTAAAGAAVVTTRRRRPRPRVLCRFLACPAGACECSRPRRPRAGPRQRLRGQRRRRDHDVLARRRAVRVHAPVGHPGEPDRPVLHAGGGRASRPRDRQGPDGPHPRTMGRPVGGLRGAHDARGEPRLDRRRVRRDRLRAGPVRDPAPAECRRRGGRRRGLHRPWQLRPGRSTCSSASASSSRSPTSSRRTSPQPDWGMAFHRPDRPAARPRRRPTGSPSSERWSAPPSRRGARRSSSRTSPTRDSARRPAAESGRRRSRVRS